MSERVDFFGTCHLADFRQMTAFRDDNDAIVLAMIVVVLEQRAYVIDVDLFFRNENDVSTGSNTGGISDPAGRPGPSLRRQ